MPTDKVFRNTPSAVIVAYIVDEIKQLSDAQPDALQTFGRTLVAAHQKNPYGMTIEVGTRAGGSALLFAKLLDFMYDRAPPLITVDPYGLKPYLGGDHEPTPHLRPYGEQFYCVAKGALAPYPNHSHYLLESMDFFTGLVDKGMWFSGVKLPFRNNASFVLLDGNHDAESIAAEAKIVMEKWLRSGGTIFIDNARNDPNLPKLLPQVKFVGREWAIIETV